MEDDRGKPYSVLTRDEVKENMKKQIDEISEIFLVSKSDATVLLMNLRWNSYRVLERLSEDKEKLLTELGLKQIAADSNQDLSASIDMFFDFDDDDELISTPFCAHLFSTTSWREYLDKNFYSLGKIQTITCPEEDCRAAVGPETIEKLTVRDQGLYEGYVLRSYLEGVKNEMIKQCPAHGCDYVIEFHREKDLKACGFNVVCLCGHTFCWKCGIESHVPVTCNNASDWFRDLTSLKEVSDESRSLSWIETNTKPCPFCLAPVELGSGYRISRFVTCECGGEFCWKCLRSEDTHLTGLGVVCVEPEVPLGIRGEEEITCLDRWEAAQVSLEEAKSVLRGFEEFIDRKRHSIFMTEEYIKIMREGMMLIVQSRQILKWSCVYDNLLTEYEMSKKVYLRSLQDNATALLHGFSETVKREAMSPGAFDCLKEKLSSIRSGTRDFGNYFYHFVKALQDGLVEVKVKSYDDFGGRYWFCDRCTYGNTWFDMKCKMCVASNKKEQMDCVVDATASPDTDQMTCVEATESTEEVQMDCVNDAKKDQMACVGVTAFMEKDQMACVVATAFPEKDQMDCVDATASSEKDQMACVDDATASPEKDQMACVEATASKEDIMD